MTVGATDGGRDVSGKELGEISSAVNNIILLPSSNQENNFITLNRITLLLYILFMLCVLMWQQFRILSHGTISSFVNVSFLIFVFIVPVSTY